MTICSIHHEEANVFPRLPKTFTITYFLITPVVALSLAPFRNSIPLNDLALVQTELTRLREHLPWKGGELI